MDKKIDLFEISKIDLLNLKLSDLNLSLKNSWLEPHINKFYKELKDKGLNFRPHIWVSQDWYSPDGVPGLALPFFLLHPRLMELEKEMIGEVEGGSDEWFFKLLRHEAGHAIDNAFRLRKIKRRQTLFGLTSVPYPETYDRKPYSKQYVRHLDASYAQAHPDEDWAETFAVWLDPKSNWEKTYASWPCLKKLEMVNEIMGEIKGKTQPVKNSIKTDTLKGLNMTLGGYYQEKRKRFGLCQTPFYKNKLNKLISIKKSKISVLAAPVFKRQKKVLCKKLAEKNNIYQYQAEQFLNEFVLYCSDKKVQIEQSDAPLTQEWISFLLTQSKNYVKMGKHRINM